LISKIAMASREQADGMSQIHAAMTSMNQMVQNNASLTEQSAQLSRDMSKWADEILLEGRQLANFIRGKSKTAQKTAATDGKQEHLSESGGINKNQRQLIEA
jgi:methyl-accepting chemotaxis protein